MSSVSSELRATTEGVRPLRPVFFWDFDHTSPWAIEDFARSYLTAYDVYESSPGRHHLVGKVDSWDRAQELLFKAAKWFPVENYIMSCRRQRLRIGPKIMTDQGPLDAFPRKIVVAEAPKLLICRCLNGHVEKRVGSIETYTTPVHEI